MHRRNVTGRSMLRFLYNIELFVKKQGQRLRIGFR
jgi:hypothetical protein